MPHDFQQDDLLIANAARCCQESRNLIAACRRNDGDISALITSSIERLSTTMDGNFQNAEPRLFRKATWAHHNVGVARAH